MTANQHEIIEFLKRNKGRKFLASEIKRQLAAECGIHNKLAKLREFGMVNFDYFRDSIRGRDFYVYYL